MIAPDNAIDQFLPGRTVPTINGETAPFFEAAARGKLVIQRCVETGQYQYYPRARSVYTFGEIDWVAAQGSGIIYSFTVVRMNAVDPVFARLVPYVVAQVELPEGIRMFGNVTGCSPDDVRVGMPVEVYFAPIGEGGKVHMPFWRPTA